MTKFLVYTWCKITVAAPLIAAASIQKMFFCQLAAASIQEKPLIKKKILQLLSFELESIFMYIITFSSNFSYINNIF